MPSSRPKPLCLKPPNGVDGLTDELELIESTPVSSARATRSARAPFSVQIEPESPYGVSLAMRTASSSSANGITAATGPNTSSLATRSLFDASTSVHGNQKPGLAGAALDRAGGTLNPAAPDPRGAGEANLRHVRMLDQTLSDNSPRPDDDVEDALRDSRLERELGEAHRRQRRQLRRLEHDRVPA